MSFQRGVANLFVNSFVKENTKLDFVQCHGNIVLLIAAVSLSTAII